MSSSVTRARGSSRCAAHQLVRPHLALHEFRLRKARPLDAAVIDSDRPFTLLLDLVGQEGRVGDAFLEEEL
eukprot:scaffold240586_cov31-Tisochrysis_lutea.AAC.2